MSARREGAAEREGSARRGGAARPVVDPDRTTVNELVALRPESLEPLSRFGVDTCCGGALTLRTVAERHGFELEALLEAVDVRAVGVGAVGAASDDGADPDPGGAAGPSCGCGCGPPEAA